MHVASTNPMGKGAWLCLLQLLKVHIIFKFGLRSCPKQTLTRTLIIMKAKHLIALTNKKLALLVTLMLMSSVSSSEDNSELFAEFQKACDRIESSIHSEAYKSETSPVGKMEILQEDFFNGFEMNDVKESFEAVMMVAPTERYETMKSQIFESTGKSWNCPIFERVQDPSFFSQQAPSKT